MIVFLDIIIDYIAIFLLGAITVHLVIIFLGMITVVLDLDFCASLKNIKTATWLKLCSTFIIWYAVF